MKFVKFSIFALTMGLFVASCGNSETTEETTTDSTATEMAAPVTVDTMTAAPVTTDSTAVTVDTAAHTGM